MNAYVDLLIVGNDLVLDPSHQPLLIDGRASIAQDIAHMIRDSGLLVMLIAERDNLRQRDGRQQLELLVEADERLVPGTARVLQGSDARYVVTASTLKFGHLTVTV